MALSRKLSVAVVQRLMSGRISTRELFGMGLARLSNGGIFAFKNITGRVRSTSRRRTNGTNCISPKIDMKEGIVFSERVCCLYVWMCVVGWS